MPHPDGSPLPQEHAHEAIRIFDAWASAPFEPKVEIGLLAVLIGVGHALLAIYAELESRPS